jgi:hypothetical protein
MLLDIPRVLKLDNNCRPEPFEEKEVEGVPDLKRLLAVVQFVIPVPELLTTASIARDVWCEESSLLKVLDLVFLGRFLRVIRCSSDVYQRAEAT